MECDRNRLQDYVHETLSADGRAAVDEHLAACATCRAALAEIAERASAVADRLAALDPGSPAETADPSIAFARFRSWTRTQQPHIRTTLKSRIEMFTRTIAESPDVRRRWRLAAIGVAVIAALVTVISYAPARDKLAEFLSIFRVRQFSAIQIDRAQLDKLSALQETLKKSNIAAPICERQPGPPQKVASGAEATTAAGFTVQVPDALPPGAVLKEFNVTAGPSVRVDFDPQQIESILAGAGINGVKLPPMKAGSVRVDVGNVVEQAYEVPNGGKSPTAVRVVQAISPAVTLPPGADPTALGETFLQILGLPSADAHRIAATIDWTSTMVIPMPVGLASFREIKIHGTPGLFMEQNRQAGEGAGHDQPTRHMSVILWQDGGIVYSVMGQNITPSEMLRIAESLR